FEHLECCDDPGVIVVQVTKVRRTGKPGQRRGDDVTGFRERIEERRPARQSADSGEIDDTSTGAGLENAAWMTLYPNLERTHFRHQATARGTDIRSSGFGHQRSSH